MDEQQQQHQEEEEDGNNNNDNDIIKMGNMALEPEILEIDDDDDVLDAAEEFEEGTAATDAAVAEEEEGSNGGGGVDEEREDKKRAAAAASPNKASVGGGVFIDLFDEEDGPDDDDGAPAAAAAAAPAAPTNSGRRRKRQKSNAVAGSAVPANVEAIEIGVDGCVDGDEGSMTLSGVYRQALGPLRFEFVDCLSKHSFASTAQNTRLDTAKIYKELIEYQLNLPIELSSSVFIRVVDVRLDLARALITGPEETPYGFGAFLFDIHLTDYPRLAPKVKFLTTGGGRVRFNPNLYNCGKVCLSLLGTWVRIINRRNADRHVTIALRPSVNLTISKLCFVSSCSILMIPSLQSGPGWQSNQSTLLQVLVSIQGLILVPDPYFNEPGYSSGKNAPHHQKMSAKYNANIRRQTMQVAMIEHLQKLVNVDERGTPRSVDYPEFTEVMVRHFCLRADAIAEQVDGWVAEDASLGPLSDRLKLLLHQLQDLHRVSSEDGDAEDDLQEKKPAAEPIVLTIDDD